jgi:hypothetical protein
MNYSHPAVAGRLSVKAQRKMALLQSENGNWANEQVAKLARAT